MSKYACFANIKTENLSFNMYKLKLLCCLAIFWVNLKLNFASSTCWENSELTTNIRLCTFEQLSLIASGTGPQSSQHCYHLCNLNSNCVVARYLSGTCELYGGHFNHFIEHPPSCNQTVGNVFVKKQYCPSDYTIRFDALPFSRYKFYNEARSWELAKLQCEQDGGKLVQISTAEENNLLQIGSGEQWLIGLSQKSGSVEPNGGFYWSGSNEPIKFSDWGNGQPDNYLGIEDCGSYLDGFKKWNDVKCNGYSAKFLCECNLL